MDENQSNHTQFVIACTQSLNKRIKISYTASAIYYVDRAEAALRLVRQSHKLWLEAAKQIQNPKPELHQSIVP